MYYVNVFLLYSFFGFIFENFICLILKNNPESGILYGPWTPIYGLGVLIIMFIYNRLKQKKETTKGILLFIISFIFLTIIEYIGGVSIKFIFDKTLWNYTGLPLHIGKYISIEVSFIWAIGSLIYIYLLKPITDNIILVIPKLITYIVSILFILDFIITLKINIR